MKFVTSILVLFLLTSVPSVQADPVQIYGHLQAGMQNLDRSENNVTADSGTKVGVTATSLGFKGKEQLTATLRAVYKLEWDLAVDAAGKTTLDTQEALVGVNSRTWGTVVVGRYRTPLALSTGVDLFADTGASNAHYGSDEEAVMDQVLSYVSPAWNDFRLGLALMPSETENGTGDDADESSGLLDAGGLALMWGNKKQGIYLALAGNQYDPHSSNSADKLSAVRLTSQIVAGHFVGGLLIDQVKTNDDHAIGDHLAWQLGLSYRMNQLTPKFKWGRALYDKDGVSDLKGIAWGADYEWSETTKWVFVNSELSKPHETDYRTELLLDMTF